jgi:ribosomal protein L18
MPVQVMTIRQQNRLRRNERIRQAFRQRYTEAPRPRKFSREYVLAQLADDYCLAVATIEDIIYAKADDQPVSQAHSLIA